MRFLGLAGTGLFALDGGNRGAFCFAGVEHGTGDDGSNARCCAGFGLAPRTRWWGWWLAPAALGTGPFQWRVRGPLGGGGSHPPRRGGPRRAALFNLSPVGVAARGPG